MSDEKWIGDGLKKLGFSNPLLAAVVAVVHVCCECDCGSGCCGCVVVVVWTGVCTAGNVMTL